MSYWVYHRVNRHWHKFKAVSSDKEVEAWARRFNQNATSEGKVKLVKIGSATPRELIQKKRQKANHHSDPISRLLGDAF